MSLLAPGLHPEQALFWGVPTPSIPSVRTGAKVCCGDISALPLPGAVQVLRVVHLAEADTATLGSHAASAGAEAGACSMAVPAQAGAHFNCRLFPQGC